MIPLQDEERSVLALLASVRGQVRPPDEVVLVDAGSRDATLEHALSVDLPFPMRVIRCERVFPGTARNAGVAAAAFDWLAFTDGGIILHPRWLAELLAVADETTDVVLGNFEPICDTFFRECAAIAYVPQRDTTGKRTSSIASCLVRRHALAQVGGFPPYRAAEDLIFFDRIGQCSLSMASAPRATVYWTIAGSVKTTFARFSSYSYHNLLAGWGHRWHLGVARLYGVLALMILAGVGAGWTPWAWLLLPAFFVSRAARAAWLKRSSFSFPTLGPSHVCVTALLLIAIDAATLWGLLRWIVSHRNERVLGLRRG